MILPLLGGVKQKEIVCAYEKFLCCITFALLICSFIPHAAQKVETPENVGAIRAPAQLQAATRAHQRPSWMPHVNAYFILGKFMTFQHGDAYAGKEHPEIPFENCGTINVTCTEFCRARMIAASDAAMDDLPKFCKKNSQQCWNTSKTRCWNEFGGNSVFDGQNEWSLTRHFQGDESVEIKWMHVFTPPARGRAGWDMLIFGSGRIRPVEQICEDIKNTADLMSIAENMFPNQNIVVAGHSEGSGWAICFNKILASVTNFGNERLMIGSGVLVPETRAFYLSLDPYSQSHSLFLLVENRSPDGLIPNGFLPDILTLLSVDQGATFPSFAFSCDLSSTTCNSITKEANLVAASQRIEALQQSPNPAARDSLLALQARFSEDLHRVHDFHNYKKCYAACFRLFNQHRNFNFAVNTPIFVKNIPEDERVPSLPGGCKLC